MTLPLNACDVGDAVYGNATHLFATLLFCLAAKAALIFTGHWI